ncbi:BLOC-2 complex member HPS6-like [Babylonia areolata]|uniref:BLOC-2 complex member HPS6-like n=1 Tax=Babylonia areolata TaxID=304850 RepID=UPI003FD06788
MTKFSARSLTSCVPICRSDLFEEVTQNDSGQQVSKVWMVPGHVFVAVENGRKLMTFDCKPATYQHSIASSMLDFPALKPALLDIFISPLSSSIAYIIQQNGHVHCWQFTSTYQWSSLAEFDLCDDAGSEVTNICLHSKRHTFYWCELQAGQKSTYRICSSALPDSTVQMTKRSWTSEVILHDCPSSDLFPLDYGLLIVPRCMENESRVSIFWQPSILQMVSVVTVIGSSVTNHHDMRSPLVFSDVLLNNVADLSQVSAQGADLGAKQDHATGLIVLLQLDGTVQSFHVIESDMKQSIAIKCVKISMPDAILRTSHPRDAWNIHRDTIAIATHVNTVRLYSSTEGQLLHELELDIGISLQSLVCVRSPTVLVAMVTSAGVILVQGGKRTKRTNKEQCLPSDKHFQTDALQVAFLAQQREENPGHHISEELSALHRKWTSLQDREPRSCLSDTVDSYLAEFWHLEEEASKLGKSQAQCCPEDSVLGAKEMVQKAVTRTRGMSPDDAMSELICLSQKYPQELLAVLLGDLDVEKEKLTAEDQAVWQTTLGLESGDGQAHPQHCSVTFELVCRLLYQERPEALVAFVRNAQTVSEQSVGVSAFVRRKHTLQYHMRAMECLPEPSLSKDPQKAALAKAQIIFKGAAERGPEVALRFLLRHCQWSEAISLLRGLGTSFPQYSSLFSLLLQRLLQCQALSDYASEVFRLLPSWKSFLPALNVMGENSSSQLTTSSPSLFCSGPADIPLLAVQPHLMALLKDQQK